MAVSRAQQMESPARLAQRSSDVRARPEAFGAVYREHHQALYRYCRAILGSDEDASDALQSTMMRAYAALQTEDRDFELRPWLFRIAHNESVSLLRQRRPTVELEAAGAVAGDSLDRRVGEREDLATLRTDLGDLPDRQRSALVMRELSGLAHEEIAAALGVSPSAAKQTIFEARTALHQCREGRAMACEDIRRAVSDADGRVLRARRVRAHLRSCRGCRDFSTALRRRPQQLGAIAPPLPAAAGAALLAHFVSGAKLAGLGAGSVSAAGAGGTIATKLVIAVAVTGIAAGGATAVQRHSSHRSDARAVPRTIRTPLVNGPVAPAAADPGSRVARQDAARGATRPARHEASTLGAQAPPAAATPAALAGAVPDAATTHTQSGGAGHAGSRSPARTPGTGTHRSARPRHAAPPSKTKTKTKTGTKTKVRTKATTTTPAGAKQVPASPKHVPAHTRATAPPQSKAPRPPAETAPQGPPATSPRRHTTPATRP